MVGAFQGSGPWDSTPEDDSEPMPPQTMALAGRMPLCRGGLATRTKQYAGHIFCLLVIWKNLYPNS